MATITPQDTRTRVTVELSMDVALLLDHISGVTGTSRTSIVLQALLDALPSLAERADSLKARTRQLGQQQKPIRR